MGKTKTFIVPGSSDDKKTGKEAYAEKMAKKAAIEANKMPSKAEPAEEVNVEKTALVDETAGVSEVPKEEAKSQRKLKVRGKKYKSAYSKVNKEKLYKAGDALKLLREIKFSNFDETVELHITTKSSPINVNATLPHSTGKQKVVEIATEATLEKLKAGKVDFDVLVATADMMPKLVPFARVLGPKGLMPNPKNGTLIKNAKEADKFGGNAINLKTQKDSNAIHTVAGKLSMKDAELTDNMKAITDAVGEKQIVKLFVKSTMSPSIKVQV